MRKGLIEILVFIGGVGIIIYLLLTYNVSQPVPPLLIALLVNIITTPLYVGIVEGVYNLYRLPLVFKTQLIYRNKDVRLSIPYLFRIKKVLSG